LAEVEEEAEAEGALQRPRDDLAHMKIGTDSVGFLSLHFGRKNDLVTKNGRYHVITNIKVLCFIIFLQPLRLLNPFRRRYANTLAVCTCVEEWLPNPAMRSRPSHSQTPTQMHSSDRGGSVLAPFDSLTSLSRKLLKCTSACAPALSMCSILRRKSA